MRVAVVAALLAAAACRHGGSRGPSEAVAPAPPSAGAPAAPGARAAAAERRRIVVLPVQNLTGASAPVKEIADAIERALARRFEIMTGAGVEEFLARHRMRYSGGIDAEEARAVRDELGADAVLITALETYRVAGPPELGITMRLVEAGDQPIILWMDQASRAGDESPGLLGLGRIDSLQPIQDRVVGQLVASLAAALDRDRRPERCGGGLWYRPRVRARSAMLDRDEPYTLAVIPFFDYTSRRGAGEVISLELVRQLVATGRFRVLEPGVVRSFLLQRRLIMPGGVSLEATRLLLGALGVELVASGSVFDYTESEGSRGPTIRFSTVLLDGGTGEVVWHSSSFNHGDDGVFAFGLGRIGTAGALTCRMVGGVVDQLTRGKKGPVPEIARWKDPIREAIEHPKPGSRERQK